MVLDNPRPPGTKKDSLAIGPTGKTRAVLNGTVVGLFENVSVSYDLPTVC